MSLMLNNGLLRQPSAGGGSFAFSQESDLEAPTPGAADETFSAMAFGTADANRDVYVAVGYVMSGNTVNAVDIGGVSASLVVEQTVGAEKTCIWKAAVPTGTTGDVVVKRASGTFSACSISVYRVVDGSDGVTATDNDGGTTVTLSANTTLNDAAIFVVQARNGTNFTGNWSAALTEDAAWDANSNEWFSAAHNAGTLAGGTPQAFTVTCAGAGAGDSACMCVITPDP